MLASVSDPAVLRAPFPWFGGKSRVADLVWSRFGNVPNYIEPFFGSGAVLLGRPHAPRIETVNDKDGFVVNAWRALAADPGAVSQWADWPSFENDLHARHSWLLSHRDTLVARLEGDPEFYDAQIAGWWLWGMAQWIGGGFCDGSGPWHVRDGQLVHLGNAGQGVARKRVHLGNAGQGVARKRAALAAWFTALQARLQRVRVCCGDWSRICGETPTVKHWQTGVFLDPPYDQDDRAECYRVDENVSAAVRTWALAHGDDPRFRIILCGYEGTYEMPETWETVAWRAHGGYGSQGEGRGRDNATRERLWCSPHCLTGAQGRLW
jgi:DNA adenine methylase